MQANVARGRPATEAALELARRAGADILQLQEPSVWLHDRDKVYVPCKHPDFTIFVPQPDLKKRPRAITYVRNGRKWLTVTQRQDLLAIDTPDVVVLQLNGMIGPAILSINIYNAPRGDPAATTGLRAFLRSEIDGHRTPVLASGDFNAHDATWASEHWNGRRNMAGRLLSDWMGRTGWSLVLEEGTATYNVGHENGGSAIDLVLQSPALQNRGWVSECRTRPDLATGADHEVIWTVMEPLQRQAAAEGQQQGKSRFAERKMDVKAFTEALRPLVEGLGEKTRAAEEAARNEDPLASRQIEEAAENCQSAIVAALSASTPVRTGKRGGYEWWTAECAKAHKAMTSARTALQRRRSAPRRPSRQEEVSLSENKALFRRALSKAKRTWVRRLVDELQGNDIFKAMHWAEAKRQYRSPPLKDSDDTLHVSASAKAKLLRAVLLPTPEPADLPPLDLHAGNERTEDDIDVTNDEIETALFSQKPNKAPGPDYIGFQALRSAWPTLKDPITSLVRACLTAGVHPATFKKATLVALRKSGNRDPARPRSYRLIALLCCLGKVMEKIVATRLTHLAHRKGWVPSEQFGGMPGKCTSDAALTFVHDVECGWAQIEQLTTTSLAVDVKGAFDATHRHRLVHLLHRLGCPLAMVRWVESFLSDREAQVSLDGELSDMESIDTGIPQGSPVSPILFLIFMGPLFKLFGPQSPVPELRNVRMIGYIDDGLLYTASPSMAENCRTLAIAYHEADTWATSNGLSFDDQKRELTHFPPPRQQPDTFPAIELQGVEVVPTPPDQTVRWLGFHFDPKLSFVRHCQISSARARKAAQCMRMLVSTVRGMSAKDARRAYVACVLPILTYGASVWWKGTHRTEPGRPYTQQARILQGDGHRPDKVVQQMGAKSILSILQREQCFALRMVLPVWRTVNTDALHQEAFCLPIEFYLDKAADMAAIRFATLEDNHPLLARVPPFGANPPPAPPEQRQPQPPPHALDASARAAQAGRRFSTRLTLLAQHCHEGIERVGRRQAPWEESLLQHERVTVQLAGSGGRTKEEAAEFHRREVAGQRLEVAVYTDGSRQEDGRTGAGWAVYYDGDLWSRAKDFTGSTREVYDAEAIALWNGLRAGTDLARRLKANRINIYSDNDAVLRSTASGASTSSQRYIRAFIRRAKEWLDEGQDYTLRMEWVPGHTDVEGNEEADELANEGAEGEEEGRVVRASLAWARRKARERALERWRTTRAETAESSTSTYFQTVNTVPTLRPSNALTLRRKDLGLLLQMRTGHGDFASYHERFHHLEAQTECICGERRTRFHPLRCPVFIKHQPLLQDEQTGRTYSKRDLLNTDAGIRAFLAFAKVSGAYERSRYEPV